MGVKFENLSRGSVVRLISGSPRMAVTGPVAEDRIEVIWWSDRLGMQADTFSCDLLAEAWPVRPPPEELPRP